MDKEAFIKSISTRSNVDSAKVETVINATLAELVSARIFGPDIGKAGILDNNCTNNCKAEQLQ